ncbi:MAG: hypothetical protein H7840_17940 [Alphaproteobacteria bacterium]
MNTNNSNKSATEATRLAIAATITALEEMLQTAHAQAAEAVGYIEDGNRNAAIGTILGLEQFLADAQALQTAAIALHRRSA